MALLAGTKPKKNKKKHPTRHAKKKHHPRRKKKKKVVAKPAPTPAPAPKPTPQPTTPAPVVEDVATVRHLANRFTGGYTPGQARQIAAAGGMTAWFARQLAPGAIAENAVVADLAGWYPLLTHTPAQRFASERANGPGSWQYGVALGNAALLRRIYTNRPVLEAMVEFWSDHLHVPVGSDGWYWRQDYDAIIRAHALGRFGDLLVAATLSPAMLTYLSSASSTATVVNENHARELLELHTLGVGYYTEPDVKATARLLSGWTVNPWANPPQWDAWYNDKRHNTDAVSVAGFASDGTGKNGQTARDFLQYLARHPTTARRLMTKLATRFVSETPSAELVSTLTSTYLAADTDIRPVLTALVAQPEFLAAAGAKVRTEESDFVATLRLLGAQVRKPTADSDAANTLVYGYGAPIPYQWPRPDGRPDRASAYSSPGRMLSSFNMHANLVGGYWPKGNVTYRTPGDLVATPTAPFTVATYARLLHQALFGAGTEPTATTVSALARAIGMTPSTTLSPTSWQAKALGSWLGNRALAVLLDHPDVLTH